MAVKLTAGQYHGEIVTSREVADLRLLENCYPPNRKLARHSHESACFSLLLGGGYTEQYAKTSLEWRHLSVGFSPPHEEHISLIPHTGARFFIAEVGPEWLGRTFEVRPPPTKSTIFRGGILSWLAVRLYKEACRMDDVSPLAIEGIMLEMGAEVLRRRPEAPEKIPRRLERAREFINAHSARRLTVAMVAEAAAVHPSHLARLFRHNYHCTIGDYVRRVRIESACREISNTDHPLAQIALDVGFYDQSHFSRTFKQVIGVSPAAYRAALRQR